MAFTPHVFSPRIAPWFGIALLALWIGWLVPAFQVLLTPARAPEDSAAIVARLLAHSPAARELAKTTVFLSRSAGCRCRTVPATPNLRAALLRSGPSLELRQAAADIGYPIVVLAPPARLVYAGPALVDIGCGKPMSLPTLLPALLSGSRQALIVPSTCPCSEES